MPSSPITFDLTGSVPDSYSMSFLQSGLSLTVSSALYYGGTGDSQLPYEFSTATLSMTGDGIGALNTYNDRTAGFDADGKYEMATLSFGQAVRITSVTLVPLGTRYNLTGENTRFIMAGDGLVIDPALRQTIDPTDFTNETSIYGSYLGIAAYGRYDQFRVSSITVETLQLASVADAYSVNSGDVAKVFDVLANDTDEKLITSINTTGILGSVSLAADGLSVSYNPGTAFDFLGSGQQATETFTYKVLGWDGTSQTQTVTVTVTGGSNTITGTALADKLTGTIKADLMLGLGGNDTLYGGDGRDNIDGGADNDRLYGNAGDDLINGGSGTDYVYGDAGNDTVIGGAGNDRLYGGDGNDNLDGTDGTDRLYGDAGNDVLTGGSSANTLDGGTGIDTMTGGAGSDSYYVDETADKIVELAAGGTDTVRSTVSYTLSDNVENIIQIGTGAINATGNALINRLTGNEANNTLIGLGGNDRLTGAGGDDRLIGGVGRDNLTGGAGSDQFVFAEFGSANYDTVTDFNADFDTIQLSAAAFGLGIGAIDASQFVFGNAATTAAQRFVYDQALGDLYFDADGNGAGARQLVASLVDGTVLTHADLFVF